MERYRPWRDAWADALYGPHGFYRRPEGPSGHFRTASHAARSGLLGAAVARLARLTRCEAVLDVGAGRGELLRAVHAADPGLLCTGVDVVARPRALPEEVRWEQQVPEPDRATLLVAWELLDVVPVPVLEVDREGRPRVVEVGEDGAERLGALAPEEDVAWCAAWWPLVSPGARAEVGRERESTWRRLVDRLTRAGGVALAVDYGHDLEHRPEHGTLRGYREGRVVRPVPDGTCDITAHVALDALTATGAGAVRLRQREALHHLGVSAARPPHHLASQDPRRYLLGLTQAGEAAELLDPAALGGFGWVLHPVGEPHASALASTALTAPAPAPPSSARGRPGPGHGEPAPPGR